MIRRVCIVEDDPMINEYLSVLVGKMGYEVSGQYYDGATVEKQFKSEDHDICLMDISLGTGKDGIELAQSKELDRLPIIYITSFVNNELVERAKLDNTKAFLTKPIKESDLKAALLLANHKLSMSKSERDDRQMFIKSEGKLIRIEKSDILFVEAFDNYCYFQFINERYLVPYTLKAAEEKLNSPMFFRTHRSQLVNINKISAINGTVISVGSFELKVSLNRKPLLLDKLVIL